MGTHETRRPWASLSNSSRTCTASSRVGTRTRACGGAPLRAGLSCSRIGIANAAVLPVPVRAWPSTSIAGEGAGNDAGLNRRGFEISRAGERGQHDFRQAQVAKSDRRRRTNSVGVRVGRRKGARLVRERVKD